VLEVDSRSEGEFIAHDLTFLQGAANILGMAIERQRHESSLRSALDRQHVLVKEINHRVKNSLSIVSSMLTMQARLSNNERVMFSLQEAASRVGTIARAHERLYQSTEVEELDLGTYLKDVCNDLPLLSECKVYTEAPAGIRMSTDRAISLALIVVELVTNAVKYAYEGTSGSIWVAVTTNNDNIVVSIRDQGRGLPDGFDLERHAGFGMRIVRALASQLEAEVVPIRHDRGAEFVVRAPLLAEGGSQLAK
jgi:two-component sensor histidine kinase